MRAEEVRIEADRRDPARDKPSVLSGGHGAVATATTAEEKFTGFLSGSFDVVVDGLPCLLGQLKPDWPTGLLLPYRRTIDRVPTRRHVLDPKCDHITAPQLAVD